MHRVLRSRKSPAVTVSGRNDAEGVTYVRIVNALDAEAEIDLNQVLEELGVSAESRASATAPCSPEPTRTPVKSARLRQPFGLKPQST